MTPKRVASEILLSEFRSPNRGRWKTSKSPQSKSDSVPIPIFGSVLLLGTQSGVILRELLKKLCEPGQCKRNFESIRRRKLFLLVLVFMSLCHMCDPSQCKHTHKRKISIFVSGQTNKCIDWGEALHLHMSLCLCWSHSYNHPGAYRCMFALKLPSKFFP